MGKIVPFPVLIIPFPVLKINYEPLGTNGKHFVKEVFFYQRSTRINKDRES